MSWVTRLAATTTVIALVAVGADASMAAVAGTPAAGASPGIPGQVNGVVTGQLNGVAAVSADVAWAVGYTGGYDQDAKTLIMRWNGREWSVVARPKPVPGVLWGVTATSADNAWAVGTATAPDGSAPRPLVMHWNGRAWSRQAGVPAVSGGLNAVTVAGDSVWAVGGTTGKGNTSGQEYYKGPSLILHLASGHWYVVPNATSAPSGIYGVTITRGGIGWAAGVGDTGPFHLRAPFLLRWNGTAWEPVPFPLASGSNTLSGMTESPGGTVWVVGYALNNGTLYDSPISMWWNGVTWRSAPVPAPADSVFLGAGSIPGGTVWAVGGVAGRIRPGIRPASRPGTAVTPGSAIIMRWTGTAWALVSAPFFGTGAALSAVAATSTRDAWAVGSWSPLGGAPNQVLILHWNGKTWS